MAVSSVVRVCCPEVREILLEIVLDPEVDWKSDISGMVPEGGSYEVVDEPALLDRWLVVVSTVRIEPVGEPELDRSGIGLLMRSLRKTNVRDNNLRETSRTYHIAPTQRTLSLEEPAASLSVPSP